MKALLMYHDRDFDLQQPLPWNAQALIQDLELHTLFNAMALGDPFVREVAKSAVLSGVHNDVHTILYHQHILKDCLHNPAIVRELYAIAVTAIEGEKKNYWNFFMKHPASVLHRSVEVLQMFVTMLKKLTHLADEHADRFASEGFTALFTMLKHELDDAYFARVQQHLRALQYRDGVLLSATLGQSNKGTNYVLRKAPDNTQSWRQRLFGLKPPVYTFHLHPRDEGGARALAELKDRGINLVAHALAQSTDHILSFFTLLRTELAFYMGCLNLHEQLVRKGEPVCFPLPVAASERRHAFRGLYDVCLTLRMAPRVVGNDVQADQTDLVIITGANQGGKSTFLRSIGVAQLLMQCGMFAPAVSFSANLCDGLYTHYKREEDATMHSGKLDEELRRMSEIVDHLTANSMVLFNESFAATNEREGSEIARQITYALGEKRIKMFFVTHVYTFARSFVARSMANVLFLRAERQADGGRTFKLVEGEPLQTSYGADVYHMVFGDSEAQPPAVVPAGWSGRGAVVRSAVWSNTPGVKGTSVDRDARWDGIDVEACSSYTRSRQTRQGGFCFCMDRAWGVEEPNTPDTYAAVAIFRLLDRAVPEVERCWAWLQAQQDAAGGYPTLVIGFAALKALQLLGARPLRDPRRFLQDQARLLHLTDPAHLHFPGQLCSALRCLRLWQDYSLTVTEQMRAAIAVGLGQLRGDNGGYGAPGANLLDTTAAVALAAILALPVDRAVLAYARQCERPPYGFHVTPLTTSSSLESQHAGLQVLQHFHALPRELARMREFVASCQTASGGFGRAPGAVPRLDDTLHALEILVILAPHT
jgi:hypothetical protein